MFSGIIFGVAFLFFIAKDDFLLGRKLTPEYLQYPVILLDRNGEEIYRSFKDENREWMEISEFPEILKKATVQAEDRRFYSHHGIDWRGIARAFFVNLKSGSIVEGGSTITQQLARKVFLSDERSIRRKVREMFIAFGIESQFSKDEILEMYLNTVPYGPRTNGVAVAAKEYFGKSPSELTEAESLMLAVMPKNPVQLRKKTDVRQWLGDCKEGVECHPFSEDYARSRLEILLEDMQTLMGWSDWETRVIWDEFLTIRLPKNTSWAQSNFQHFQFFVKDFLIEKGIDPSKIGEGLVIKTTIDANLQNDIVATFQEKQYGVDFILKDDIGNYAYMILDHASRGPLVWIGSRSFWDYNSDGQVDMLRSRRQIGSAIKPFIYAAAITRGYQPPTILYDSRVWFAGDKKALQNSDGHYLGGIRMTDALAKSRNIPAAKSFFLAGGEQFVLSYLDRLFGFDIRETYPDQTFGWTIALGTSPLRLMDVANAYATLGSTERKEICPILEMRTATGKLLKNPCNQSVLARINEKTSFMISDILSNIEARPTDYKWRENLTLENTNIAAKTGTATKRVSGTLFPIDNVVVGYSPNTTFLMWAGNADGSHFKQYRVAATTLAPIWKEMTEKFYAKYPSAYASFKQPEGLHKVHGEWATLDYKPLGYEALVRVANRIPERWINPLYALANEN